MKKCLAFTFVVLALFSINAESGGLKDLIKKEVDKKLHKKNESKKPPEPKTANPPPTSGTAPIAGPAISKTTKFAPCPKPDGPFGQAQFVFSLGQVNANAEIMKKLKAAKDEMLEDFNVKVRPHRSADWTWQFNGKITTEKKGNKVLKHLRGNYNLTNASDGLAEVLVTIPTQKGMFVRAMKVIFISGAYAPAVFLNESLEYVKSEAYQLPAKGTKILSSPMGEITFNYKAMQKLIKEKDSLIANNRRSVPVDVVYYDKATRKPLGKFTVDANPDGVTAFNLSEAIPTQEGTQYFYQAFAKSTKGRVLAFRGEALAVTTSLKKELNGSTAHFIMNGKKPSELTY